MNRRQAIVAAGTSLAGMTLLGNTANADKHKHHHHHHELGSHFEKCAKACADCQIECSTCHAHCVSHVAGGHKSHLSTLKLCADCSDICGVAASIVSRGGPLSVDICKVCADACDKCAEACEKFPDDKVMQACAKSCRKCAKACRDMIKHAH